MPVKVATVLSIATDVPVTVIPVPAVVVTILAVPSKLTPLIVLAVAKAVAVLALPVKAPTKDVDVTDVKPARVVLDAPNEIVVEPIVKLLLTSLPLAIEPANIELVTVPVSPVVTTIPVVAGSVIIVPVPAVEAGITWIEPDVDPGSVTELIPVSAKLALALFRATAVVPMYVVSVEFAIPVTTPVTPLTLRTPVFAIVTAPEPSKLVPLSPVPIVNAFVVLALIVIAAEPSNATPLILRAVTSLVAVSALPVSAPTKEAEVTDVKPARVVEEEPSEIEVVPTVTELFANLALGIEDTFEKSFLASS